MTTPGTFAQLLSPDSVDVAELRRRGYGAQLELVRVLLGVVPNSGPLLEIWPTAFRSYNMLVPNFLNLPPLLFGAGAPKQIVGLAMYVSSRAAGCAYCSAHSCSFALRRGTTAGTLATAYGSDGAQRSPAARGRAQAGGGREARGREEQSAGAGKAERAVIAAAEGLSLVPSTFTATDRVALEQHFTPSDAEWVVLSIAMMGFLNKFMDVMGVADTSAGAVEAFALGPTAYDTEQDVAAAEAALRRLDGIDEGWPAALLVAKAASFSPARVTPALAAHAAARLPPAALVELITWIAIQQLLHRLGTYFTQD